MGTEATVGEGATKVNGTGTAVTPLGVGDATGVVPGRIAVGMILVGGMVPGAGVRGLVPVGSGVDVMDDFDAVAVAIWVRVVDSPDRVGVGMNLRVTVPVGADRVGFPCTGWEATVDVPVAVGIDEPETKGPVDWVA